MIKNFIFSLATVFTMVNGLSPDGKCRVLAMRGGGVHGSFEIGVLKAFVEKLDPLEVHYDILSGVSIGALNAGVFSIFEFGKEKEAVDFLMDFYMDNLPQDNWSYWPSIFFEPFYKKSAVNNEQFKIKLTEMLKGESIKRALSIQSVDLLTGKIVIIDETIPEDQKVDALFSSASIPGIFPPTELEQFQLVDGGTFQNVSVGDPIQRCREEGVADEDIIVDVLLCFSGVVDLEQWSLTDSLFKDAYSFYLRRSEISYFYSMYEDMLRVTRGYPKVNFRHTVAPSTEVPAKGFIPISATHEMIKEEIAIGYRDGLQALNDAQATGSNMSSMLAWLKDQAANEARSSWNRTEKWLQ